MLLWQKVFPQNLSYVRFFSASWAAVKFSWYYSVFFFKTKYGFTILFHVSDDHKKNLDRLLFVFSIKITSRRPLLETFEWHISAYIERIQNSGAKMQTYLSSSFLSIKKPSELQVLPGSTALYNTQNLRPNLLLSTIKIVQLKHGTLRSSRIGLKANLDLRKRF